MDPNKKIMQASVNSIGYLAFCLQKYDDGIWSAKGVIQALREEVEGLLSELETHQNNISEIEKILSYEVADGGYNLTNFTDYLRSNGFELGAFYSRVFQQAEQLSATREEEKCK